jgi:FkbM family methyltransferase
MKKDLGANSLVPSDGITKTENIQLKKLDDFEFKNVDYIKIDVQFHELEVIEGSIDTLKNNNPVLCIEAARRNEEELSYVKNL